MKLLIAILLISPTVQGQDVPLKDYIDMKFEMFQAAESEKERIKEENIKTAYMAQDKRLDGMNEFRQALKDSNATFITKSELIAWIVAAAGLFWGYSKNQREKEKAEADKKGSLIRSGDQVEVKK